MTTSQIFGFVGTGFVIGGYILQIAHLVKERCTAGISIPALSLVRRFIPLDAISSCSTRERT